MPGNRLSTVFPSVAGLSANRPANTGTTGPADVRRKRNIRYSGRVPNKRKSVLGGNSKYETGQ